MFLIDACPVNKSVVGVVAFLMLHLGAFGQQDCFDAINVCSSSYSQTSSYVGVGSEQEVPPGSSCLSNGEVNSVWYTFTANTAGYLLFQLNPFNSGDDYDFALYSLTNDSCSGIVAGLNVPISCNYSADAGSTGISNSGSGNNNGSSGPNQNQPLAVQAGESFALLISNFTSSQSGYDLDFSGSASIIDNSAGEIDSISLEGHCNPSRISIYLTEPINCSDVAGDGSDFLVSGLTNLTISAATGTGCSGGVTNLVWLTFSGNIPTTGTYTVSINSGSDGNTLSDGCGNEISAGNSDQFVVTLIGPEVSITNVVSSDCGLDNGSAMAVVTGGSAPYTYNWNSSPSQTTPTAIGLGPGIYRVEVIDTNGCKARELVTIDNNNPLDLSNISSTGVTCNGDNDGTAQILPTGGTAPFSIEWQTNPVQTGNNAAGLSGGYISVVVTDASGCDEETSVYVPQPSGISVPTTVVNPDCAVPNGQATVNASGGNGGFTFSWNTVPVQTTATATALLASVYTVTVTDMLGCIKDASVILVDNFAPNATIESRIPDCGQGVGQATAIATSGLAPFSYSWNTAPPQNTATATGLLEGDYFVTITDANGCVQIINVKIDSVPPPVVSTVLTAPGCGLSDGQAEAVVANGLAPFTFTWSSSLNTSPTETGLAAGTYTVTVTDTTGCTDTEQFILNALPPESDLTFENACLGAAMTFISTTNSGATSWLWDFGDGTSSTDESPTHLYMDPGTYSVTLDLYGGCAPDQVTQTAEVYAPPTSTFTAGPEYITTRTHANFIYTGNGAVEFAWDLGDGTTSAQSNLNHLYGIEGFYQVSLTVTDANGCSDDTRLTIEVLLQPVIYFPNAFMPEGRVENSRFKGYGIGIESAELTVFDRWGNLLYRTSDLNTVLTKGWDGNYNGTPAGQGVYAYHVKASFYTDTSFEKVGTVTLIR